MDPLPTFFVFTAHCLTIMLNCGSLCVELVFPPQCKTKTKRLLQTVTPSRYYKSGQNILRFGVLRIRLSTLAQLLYIATNFCNIRIRKSTTGNTQNANVHRCKPVFWYYYPLTQLPLSYRKRKMQSTRQLDVFL